MAQICTCGMKELYRKEGGAFPDPIVNLVLDLRTTRVSPKAEELAQARSTGKRARRRSPIRPIPTKVRASRPASRWRASPTLRDDGSTIVRLLDLFRLLQRERATTWRGADTDRSRTGPGRTCKWAFAWPRQPAHRSTTAPRRTCRAIRGIRARKLIAWNGDASGTGYDVPDIAPTAKPGEVGAVHHEPRRDRRGCSPAA
jgi:formate dehydrogenase major subunit